MIMAPILSLGRTGIPDGLVTLANSTDVTVNAVAQDLDAHASLAIVGIAFIIAAPMCHWSSHARYSGIRSILTLWMILISIGLTCNVAILYSYQTPTHTSQMQFRFCTPGYNDTLPYTANPNYLLKDTWNSSVWSYFETQSPAMASCFYPCLSANNRLRRANEIAVTQGNRFNETIFFETSSRVSGPHALKSNFGSSANSQLFYCLLLASILLNLMIFVFRMRRRKATKLLKDDWNVLFERKERRIIIRKMAELWLIMCSVSATPVLFMAFLLWVEYIISYDLQSEPFRMVGQWAPLLGAGFIFFAAFVGKYWPPLESFWRRFWIRRDLVARGVVDEKLLESWEYARTTTSHQSAWGRSAMVLSQGDIEY